MLESDRQHTRRELHSSPETIGMCCHMCEHLSCIEREKVKMHKQMNELINAVNELQKKQPYCYDPDNPIDTLNTIGRYIDKLKQLVWYMWREITTCPDYSISPCMTPNICDRIRELGIEVNDDER